MTENSAAPQLLASVLLDDKTLLALGHAPQPLAPSGEIYLGADQPRGSFTASSWPGADERHWFLAALRVEQVTLLALRGAQLDETHSLPSIGRMTLDAGGLVAALVGAGSAPLVVAFLREQAEATRVLTAYLAAITIPDGFIEIFGRARGGELYLQGWSTGLEGGEIELLFEAGGCIANSALVATYGRPDLAAPAHGIVAVVRLADPVEPREVRSLTYRRGEGYYRLDIFENRLLFGDGETAGHAAAMLPQLQADPVVHAALKRLAAPRYQGQDTLCELPLPVKGALDMAAWVPGEGVFLVGWMLDPERRCVAVSLGMASGRRSRIDQFWIRSARRDVSEGYAQDPLFAGRIRPLDDDHGFLAFVPCPETEPGEMYLEIELADGAVAFMPVRPSRSSMGDSRRILTSFDLHHPDIDRIIARHVGPIVTAIGRQSAQAIPPRAAYDFGETTGERPRISVIVPVPMGRTDIDVTMARLAVEPALRGVELIFAAPAAAAAAIGPSLPRQARFYELPSRLVVAEGDGFEAMTAAAGVARAELLLFLGPTVLPRRSGWLGQLEGLLRATPRAAAISPTLLYEDLSVRFAGSRANGWTAPKGIAELTAYAGYARHWLAKEALRGDAAVPVHAVSAECCLITRAAFEAVGGFSAHLVGATYKGLDLSLKLRSARWQCLWAAGIEMLAPDEAAAEPEYWVRTGALVDHWGFERKWSQSFAHGHA